MTDHTYPSDHPAPTLSVVVPVYNSAGTLEILVRRLIAVLANRSREWEIILVDDGSADASWETISRLAADVEHCHGYRLMRNYGQHNALLAGIRQARFNTIVTIDDDLQNPPEEIPTLLNELSPGVDVVYGAPRKATHGLGRRLSSRITKLVLKRALGAEVATKISAFRAFRSSLRAGFANVTGPTVNLDVLLSWSTTNFQAVSVQHDERAIGASNYTLRQLIRHALNMLTGFSTMPLRMASFVGFAFTLVGIGILAYVVASYIHSGGVVPGFAFLASIIAIFSGAQLFTIGIIGEYLARMYHRMTERPSYVVRETTTLVDAK